MRNILLISLLLFSVSCTNSQVNDPGFLEQATPEEAGLTACFLDSLITDMESGRIRNIHGIVIIKDDRLVLEQYFNAFKADELHYSASITKSFASALLGIAIDRGFFEGDMESVLNTKVSELFPEYREIIARDSLKKDLKLKHMLTMTAGFEWDEQTYPYSDGRNDCYRINHSADPMKFLFERKLSSEPGSVFYYNGGLSLSISWLIEKYTGMQVDRFAEKYLFHPLGIKDYRWETVTGGLNDTDGGLHMSPMDQVKLGYLFLNGGAWNGQQVISEDWVRNSIRMHVNNANMPDYGYQWWGGDFHVRGKDYLCIFASGHGGQKILFMPEHNLVMAVSQQVFSNPFGHLNFLAILSDYIVPALGGQSAERALIEISQEELESLEGHYVSRDSEEFVDVRSGQGRLILHSSSGEQNDFYPVSSQVFSSRIMDILTLQIAFKVDQGSGTRCLIYDFAYKRKSFWLE